MRFFHLSDLHIGLRLNDVDLCEDQRYIFSRIAALAEREKPDAVIIAGDIYDRSQPSAESVALFDDFVSMLRAAVPDADIMMISGNHDSASRVNIFRNILSRQKIHMIGIPPQKPDEYIEKVTLTDKYGNVNFYLLPFVRPSMISEITGRKEDNSPFSYDEALHILMEREDVNTDERNVLVSHQFYYPKNSTPDDTERSDSEVRTVGNIDSVSSDVLERFDYAALGHIHKPMKAGGEFYRYCGTPIACSFSEAGQQKGVILVEMNEKGNISADVLPLEPLHRVTVLRGTLDEILAHEDSGDYIKAVITERPAAEVGVSDILSGRFRNYVTMQPDWRNPAAADHGSSAVYDEDMDPYDMCRRFIGVLGEELNADEDEMLRYIINSLTEEDSE